MEDVEKRLSGGATGNGEDKEQREVLRHVSRAPAPITPVGSYGLVPPRTPATQVPPHPPPGAVDNFHRVLGMEPRDFISALQTREEQQKKTKK